MLEKIQGALKLIPFGIPGPVREVMCEMAAEIDRLRADVKELRSQTDDGK